MDLQANKEKVFNEVLAASLAAGRSQDTVKIIAVTKYVDSEIAKKLIATGVTHIAENRVDKFLDKYHTLAGQGITWHLIGTLQRRKVKEVINYVDYFHALDSVKLAEEIDKRAEHVVKCFLQVNAVEELDEVLKLMKTFKHIRLVGLMTMAPIDATEQELNEIFKQTQELQQTLQKKQIENMPFSELSMGMSRDFAQAIAHGATFVRIGTAFFK